MIFEKSDESLRLSSNISDQGERETFEETFSFHSCVRSVTSFPSLVVGSAAYNLLMICALCIVAIKGAETRRIKLYSVFMVKLSPEIDDDAFVSSVDHLILRLFRLYLVISRLVRVFERCGRIMGSGDHLSAFSIGGYFGFSGKIETENASGIVDRISRRRRISSCPKKWIWRKKKKR